VGSFERIIRVNVGVWAWPAGFRPVRPVRPAESIVFDFMQPQVAGGQLVGLCGKARRDEASREAQHVG
jgi:hypothetical protein